MYGDKLNEFGELEAFNLIDKSNSVLSYDLPKEITGLSKDYFVDFSRRYKMDSQNVISRIVQIDTNNSKSISATRKILDASNFIKDANLKPSLEKNKLLILKWIYHFNSKAHGKYSCELIKKEENYGKSI